MLDHLVQRHAAWFPTITLSLIRIFVLSRLWKSLSIIDRYSLISHMTQSRRNLSHFMQPFYLTLIIYSNTLFSCPCCHCAQLHHTLNITTLQSVLLVVNRYVSS